MTGISRREKIFFWFLRASVIAVLLLYATLPSTLVYAGTVDEGTQGKVSAAQAKEEPKDETVPLQQVPAVSSQPVQSASPQQENAVPTTQSPPVTDTTPAAQPAQPTILQPARPAVTNATAAPMPGLNNTAMRIGSVAAGNKYGKSVRPGTIACITRVSVTRLEARMAAKRAL